MNPSHRLESETIDEYLVRLGTNMELYSLTWSEIAKLMNSETEEEYNESKYRKDYASYKRWKPFILDKFAENEMVNEVRDATVEFQKEKVRFQDQKREFNNIIKQQARFEHLKDEIRKSILELEKNKPLNIEEYKYDESKKNIANVLWSDFHYGQESDNSLNVYNPEIFELRFSKLVSKIIHYCKVHNVSKLTIGALGDFVNGLIHVSTRVESSENVIEQIQKICEYMAEALVEISKHVNHIKFINIVGNHARLSPNKNDSVFKENLENLIPWFLTQRLNNITNLEFHKDTDGYFIDTSFKRPHCYIHGDLDSISSVAKNLPQILGIVPAYIYGGHIHHDTVKDYGTTTVISNGSLCGIDSYGISKRLFAKPMQKMHIFDENENIEYKIDIQL